MHHECTTNAPPMHQNLDQMHHRCTMNNATLRGKVQLLLKIPLLGTPQPLDHILFLSATPSMSSHHGLQGKGVLDGLQGKGVLDGLQGKGVQSGKT